MSEPAETLVERASRGDAAAIEGLLAEHLPRLQGFLARRAPHYLRERESVADLAQSVCRETLEHLRDGRLHFQGSGAFKQWLYRAAVMKLMNRRRYWDVGARAEVARAAAYASEDGIVRESGATPSEEARFLEEAELFARALEQLSEEQRTALTLYHLEGCAHAEIAARMQISEANSRTLLARALARLARLGAATP